MQLGPSMSAARLIDGQYLAPNDQLLPNCARRAST
jgi:hypothetical protein